MAQLTLQSLSARLRIVEERLAAVEGNVLETALAGTAYTPALEPDSGFKWSDRSLWRMKGIHPDLRRVMDRALKLVPIDITVLEGVRTKERQRQLVRKGASKTMNSRHLTGHAVDIAPLGDDGQVSWDWPLYHQIAPAIKQAAAEEGVPIEWGGDWQSFKDGPHWQLPWSSYPA
jgi:peptidoglycan L-alanyl-D-glutamate endopeptidase CwlK